MISPTYTGEVYDSTASTTVERTDSETGLGQDAFLKMFLAQVTNQDPMNPMDNTEFTAQLATFSQLEQLTNIADAMEGIGRMEASIQQNTIMSYLGREITVSGNQTPVTDGQPGVISYTLAATGDVRAVITDASGATVYTEELGLITEGRQHYAWDGTDSWGNTVSDGTYTVTLTAYDSSGEAIGISDVTVTALCTGYETDEEGNHYLVMGSGAVPVSDVLGVQASTGDTGTTGGEEDDGTVLDDILEAVLKIGGITAALL